MRRRRTRKGWWRSATARIDGGMLRRQYAVAGGVSAVVPVDLHIPGARPARRRARKGLLALLDEMAKRRVK